VTVVDAVLYGITPQSRVTFGPAHHERPHAAMDESAGGKLYLLATVRAHGPVAPKISNPFGSEQQALPDEINLEVF